MRFRIRLWKVFCWGLFLVLACLGGVVGFACWYVTDSENLAGLIKAEVPRYLPGSVLSLGRVRIRPFVGEIDMTQVHVFQRIDDAGFLAIRLPWLRIRHDPRAMLKRRFAPREVVVAHPTLRLRRRKDGTWNLQGLLADPWPGPALKTPPILIQNGTVELAEGEGKAAAILRDVAVEIKPAGGKLLAFEGSAKGDLFERLSVRGTVDLATGQVSLGGDIAHLALSDTFRARLPAEIREDFDRIGLTSGEVDLRAAWVTYDPGASPRIRYNVAARLRAGVWDCPRLPFTINDLSAGLSVRDGVLEVERAEGYNGATTVRLERGRIDLGLGDPMRAPLDLQLVVYDLELDKRLQAWTPPEFAKLWTDFSPSGRISAAINLLREKPGGPLGYAWSVNCRDVAMNYRFFKYPLDHIQGTLKCEKRRIELLRLHTLVGGKPLQVTGTIDNPGDDAHVELDFKGEALPIDQTLFDALPPAIREVVAQFHPTGTVRGKAHVKRTRRVLPTDPPEGIVAVDASLELNEHCAILWDGMPYPVSNLTGKLELHPNRWTFTDMRGSNGQAVITGSGSVEKLPPGPAVKPGADLAVDLKLSASMLPFDNQLRAALPPAWQKSWATLNPVGSSNVDATIRIRPGEQDQYHLIVHPMPETSVRLEFGRPPAPGAGDPGGRFDLRMENVRGRFVFNNGPVDMEDVGFQFYGAPVQFARGRVVVKDSGQFDLGVKQVWARHFRLDQEELRKIMPPVMAQFARRLDDGRPISTIKGNLDLSWSGRFGEPVKCGWSDALVIFNDNTIQAGLPLEHLQGQLDHVRGWFDGERLSVDGALKLESVSLLGQQVTELESPFKVADGLAQLSDIRGKLLGGQVTGRFEVSLDATPRYVAALAVEGADLQRYARTLGGHQSFRGLVFGNLELNGLGNDLRTLQGRGEAHVVQGDLGELPILLRLVKKLNPTDETKSMFDSADMFVTIRNGASVLDSIRLTGSPFSLLGKGTMDVQGDLDLKFKPIYGRDRFRLPVLSDVVREASGELFSIRARGPLSYPHFDVDPLPRVADGVRSIGSRRSARADRATP